MAFDALWCSFYFVHSHTRHQTLERLWLPRPIFAFFPTVMFTQDYSALGELETNWLLTHLEESQQIVWHPVPWVAKGECGPRRPISKNHVSFWMEPLWKQVHINRAILLTFSTALKSLQKRKEKGSGARRSIQRRKVGRRKRECNDHLKTSTGLWPEEGRKENKLK